MQIDVRDVLPSVHVPTLVLHVEGDRLMPVEAGQADWPTASPGRASSHSRASTTPSGRGLRRRLVEEIERFVTGAVHRAEPNRVLTSVLFTDIVASTDACGGARRPCLARGARAPRRARRPRRLRARRAGRQAHRRWSAVGVRRPGDGDALRRGAARGSRGARHRAAERHPHRRVRGDRRGPRRPGRPHRGSCRRARGAGRDRRLLNRQGARRRLGHAVHRPRRARAEGRSGLLAPLRPGRGAHAERSSSTGRRGTCAAQTASPSPSRAGCRGRCASPGSSRAAGAPRRRRRSEFKADGSRVVLRLQSPLPHLSLWALESPLEPA